MIFKYNNLTFDPLLNYWTVNLNTCSSFEVYFRGKSVRILIHVCDFIESVLTKLLRLNEVVGGIESKYAASVGLLVPKTDSAKLNIS